MTRPRRLLLLGLAGLGLAMGAAACGTERISVPKSDPSYVADTAAAQLFNQRCGGCHTLSVAGTYGSGDNPRTFEAINGPNFNQRCERPEIRVLYAIINGGFSGAYMPQNIVVGKQALEVAHFVAEFAGRDAPAEPGTTPCVDKPIGTLPSLTSLASTSLTSSSSSGS